MPTTQPPRATPPLNHLATAATLIMLALSALALHLADHTAATLRDYQAAQRHLQRELDASLLRLERILDHQPCP